jgi:hypothetical protein
MSGCAAKSKLPNGERSGAAAPMNRKDAKFTDNVRMKPNEKAK